MVELIAGGGDLPPPTRDADEVRRLADEIMSRSEFEPPSEPLLVRAFDWILERLGDLFGDLLLGGGGTGGSNLVSLAVLAAAAVALALVVRTLVRNRRRSGRTGDDDPIAIDVERSRSLSEWEELAARHEAAGEWKQAMRCRFRVLVERLARRGVVADVPGRTSGEYRVEVLGVLPEGADDFAGAADLFERAWYGDLPTGPGEARRFEAHADRVLSAAGDRR